MRTSYEKAHRRAARWTIIGGLCFILSACSLLSKRFDDEASSNLVDHVGKAAPAISSALGFPEVGAAIAALCGLISAIHGGRMHRKAHRRNGRNTHGVTPEL